MFEGVVVMGVMQGCETAGTDAGGRQRECLVLFVKMVADDDDKPTDTCPSDRRLHVCVAFCKLLASCLEMHLRQHMSVRDPLWSTIRHEPTIAFGT